MYVDPRGPRFNAALTAAVLGIVLVTGNHLLLALQGVASGLGAVSLRYAPYGLLFRAVIQPRLAASRQLQPEGPPRFGQLVALVLVVVGVGGYVAGLPVLGTAATGIAFGVSALHAVLGICLTCRLYQLLDRRSATKRSATKGAPA